MSDPNSSPLMIKLPLFRFLLILPILGVSMRAAAEPVGIYAPETPIARERRMKAEQERQERNRQAEARRQQEAQAQARLEQERARQAQLERERDESVNGMSQERFLENARQIENGKRGITVIDIRAAEMRQRQQLDAKWERERRAKEPARQKELAERAAANAAAEAQTKKKQAELEKQRRYQFGKPGGRGSSIQ